MTIKTTIMNEKGELEVSYHNSSGIITDKEKGEADVIERKISNTINSIELDLKKNNLISNAHKKDPLLVWYKIGERINILLEEIDLLREDEAIFWQSFYNRSEYIHNTSSLIRLDTSRNSFKTASMLAQYPLEKLRNVGSWTLCSEIINYRYIREDERIFNILVDFISKHGIKRSEARPILKEMATRFKNLETSLLSINELKEKTNEVLIGFHNT